VCSSDLPFVVACEHEQGRGWSAPSVSPRAAATLPIATGGLQYGLSVFEGLKAFHAPDGSLSLFRPLDHALRLQRSARQLRLPDVPTDLLMDMARRAVEVHRHWTPPHRRGSLYLRPTLYAGEQSLGLRVARRHGLCIVATPCSTPDPTVHKRLWAERGRVRASVDGLGAAKTAANYAASIYGAEAARDRGYDDALWLDAAEHRFLAEAGTMNLFVVLRDRVLTPPLDGSILAGITRDSLLQLLRDRGIAVEESPISLQELLRWQQEGELREIFGAGTAARVAPVSEVAWDEGRVVVPGGTLTMELSQRLADLQEGVAEDLHGWRAPV
jgi:branched-chain amino acid aminotransferase